MKKISLLFAFLFLIATGFAKENTKNTKFDYYTIENFRMMVFCDGNFAGYIEGTVTVKTLSFKNSKLIMNFVSGSMVGTSEWSPFYGETFTFKDFQKEYGDWLTDPDFHMKLHFIARGDNGTILINSGNFDFINGPTNLKSICR